MSATRTPDAHPTSRARRPWREAVPEIVARIDAGCPFETAAEACGVSHWTVRDAIERGDPEADPIQDARGRLEARLASALLAHAVDGRPHGAAAYLLERLAPKRWRQAEQKEIGGIAGGEPVRVTSVPSTPAELAARLAELQRALSETE